MKFSMSGGIYNNNVTPGVYPKWSKVHLRIRFTRLESLVLFTVRTMYRTAPAIVD